MSDGTLLEATGLCKTYVDASRGVFERRQIEAVHDLSFRLARGGSLAIVGESGSGKTTTARMVVGLETPTAGMISFNGVPLTAQPGTAERRRRARKIQIVFQNPHLSLDPKQTPVAAIEEVLKLHLGVHGNARRERAVKLLASVGLAEREALSLPKRLSGGQAQRVAIARALAAEPELLVLDE